MTWTNLPAVRKFDFLTALEPLLSDDRMYLKIVVIATFANLLNEEESKLFQTNKKAVSDLIVFLDEAVNAVDRNAILSKEPFTTYSSVGLVGSMFAIIVNLY